MYYGNWVPVEVTPLSDAALVLAMVPIALVLNALFVSNRLRPLLFLLPVGLLATQTLCLGTADDLPLIGLSLFLGLALRVLSQSGAAIDSAEHVERPRIPKPVRSPARGRARLLRRHRAAHQRARRPRHAGIAGPAHRLGRAIERARGQHGKPRSWTSRATLSARAKPSRSPIAPR